MAGPGRFYRGASASRVLISAGYFLFSKYVALIMKKCRRGRIINISSISGSVGIPGQVAYGSSKGGINMLTRVMAVELGRFNITVNAIAPGSILVERNKKSMLSKKYQSSIKNKIPLGRLGTPSDISGVVKFLLSESSSYINGSIITVDGGMTSKSP